MILKRCLVVLIIMVHVHVVCQEDTTNPSFTIDQITTAQPTEDGKPVVNVSNKYSFPQAASYLQTNLYGSFMRNVKNPSHPALSFSQSGLLNAFLNNIVRDNDNYFLTYFAKMHLLILHQLYIYLTKIYTVFNLTHIDDVPSYLESETRQALNIKTLIINHLVNVIEEQINQKVLSYFPGIPKQSASRAGGLFANNDFGSSLQLLLDGSEERLFQNLLSQNIGDAQLVSQVNNAKNQIKSTRSDYIGHFADYLKLFNAYTAPLYSNGTINANAFIKEAQSIQNQLKKPLSIPSGSSLSQRAQLLRSFERVNPPLFFYDDETMRGIKLIPILAQRLPKNVENVSWPEKIVQQAKQGTRITTKAGVPIGNFPIAFFVAQDGTSLGTQTGPRLFINIASISGGNAQFIYQQELLAQPAWLNSAKGIMYMLRACVGDFARLLDAEFDGQSILDPCLQCILQDAANVAGISSGANQAVCNECQTYLQQIDQSIKQNLVKPTIETYTPPELPSDLPSLPGGL